MVESDTRLTLLAVAIDRFGTYGLEATSTRQIAEAAKTPMSAITYHFGSKEGLYRAAAAHIADNIGDEIKRVLASARSANAGNAASEIRLVFGRLLRIMLAEQYAPYARFTAREQSEPTEAFEILFAGIIGPVLDWLQARLSEVSGGELSVQEARVRAVALLGQLLVFRMGHAAALRAAGWKKFDEGALRLIEHVVCAQLDAILGEIAAPQPRVALSAANDEVGHA